MIAQTSFARNASVSRYCTGGVDEGEINACCGTESSGEDAKVPCEPGEGGEGDGCHADGEFQGGSFGVGEGAVAGCADVFYSCQYILSSGYSGKIEEPTIDRGVGLRQIHPEVVADLRAQMSGLGRVARLPIYVVDEQGVGCGQQRHRGIGLVLLGVPDDLARLLHAHVARDGVGGAVQTAGRNDVDGGRRDRERGVVPHERHMVAHLVVSRGAVVGRQHGDTARRHAGVDRGGFGLLVLVGLGGLVVLVVFVFLVGRGGLIVLVGSSALLRVCGGRILVGLIGAGCRLVVLVGAGLLGLIGRRGGFCFGLVCSGFFCMGISNGTVSKHGWIRTGSRIQHFGAWSRRGGDNSYHEQEAQERKKNKGPHVNGCLR